MTHSWKITWLEQSEEEPLVYQTGHRDDRNSPGILAMHKAPQWENGETANNKRGREASGEVDWGGRLALRSPIFHSRAE